MAAIPSLIDLWRKLVVNEKKDQTLTFMMSLPVTAQDYAWAKLGANLVLYLVPWLLLVAGMLLGFWLHDRFVR